jgi:hypothetical protein
METETSFYNAWVELYQQRDMLYLVMFGAVVVALYWANFFKIATRISLTVGMAALVLGLTWGLAQM